MKNNLLALACAATLATLAPFGSANTPPTPKAQLAADTREAQARYESDRLLCNDETSANGRLQCRRDARAEFDKAMAAARSRMHAATAPQAPGSAPASAPCADCGTVVAISVTEKAGEGSAVGMIAGGVGGALLGRQIGDGTGRDLATIAGALGGAYAGKKIEARVKTHKVWSVSVQYPDGSKRSFDFEKDPTLKVGDHVRNSGSSVVRHY